MHILNIVDTKTIIGSTIQAKFQYCADFGITLAIRLARKSCRRVKDANANNDQNTGQHCRLFDCQSKTSRQYIKLIANTREQIVIVSLSEIPFISFHLAKIVSQGKKIKAKMVATSRGKGFLGLKGIQMP